MRNFVKGLGIVALLCGVGLGISVGVGKADYVTDSGSVFKNDPDYPAGLIIDFGEDSFYDLQSGGKRADGTMSGLTRLTLGVDCEVDITLSYYIDGSCNFYGTLFWQGTTNPFYSYYFDGTYDENTGIISGTMSYTAYNPTVEHGGYTAYFRMNKQLPALQ